MQACLLEPHPFWLVLMAGLHVILALFVACFPNTVTLQDLPPAAAATVGRPGLHNAWLFSTGRLLAGGLRFGATTSLGCSIVLRFGAAPSRCPSFAFWRVAPPVHMRAPAVAGRVAGAAAGRPASVARCLIALSDSGGIMAGMPGGLAGIAPACWPLDSVFAAGAGAPSDLAFTSASHAAHPGALDMCGCARIVSSQDGGDGFAIGPAAPNASVGFGGLGRLHDGWSGKRCGLRQRNAAGAPVCLARTSKGLANYNRPCCTVCPSGAPCCHAGTSASSYTRWPLALFVRVQIAPGTPMIAAMASPVARQKRPSSESVAHRMSPLRLRRSPLEAMCAKENHNVSGFGLHSPYTGGEMLQGANVEVMVCHTAHPHPCRCHVGLFHVVWQHKLPCEPHSALFSKP